MKPLILSALLAATASMGLAAEKYTVDPSHSQAIFSYNHAGFSTTQGMFSGFEGEIMFDQENPANSSVTVSIPTKAMNTGWAQRDEHLLETGDFFKLEDHPIVSFTSTSIEVTSENTALITGDLSLNGVSKPVVLDAQLNGTTAEYPFPPYNGKPAAGFTATTSFLRSDYNLGMFAPFVGDEIAVEISIEAMKLD